MLGNNKLVPWKQILNYYFFSTSGFAPALKIGSFLATKDDALFSTETSIVSLKVFFVINLALCNGLDEQ